MGRELSPINKALQTWKRSIKPQRREADKMIFQKDYWKLKDTDLELSASKYNIPAIIRAGKRGDQWSIDRGNIITALVGRDAAIRTNWAIIMLLVSLVLSIISLAMK
jgi:hypothetical protein